ncbi:MAG: serine hydrolase [Melioribacteraceae bacterium]
MLNTNYKSILKTFCFFFSISTFSVYSQNTTPAIAYPIPPIVIDGNLNDWASDLPRYQIKENLNAEHSLNDDFIPSFMIGYNLKQKCLYLGIEVIDNDHIIGSGESNGIPEDYTLLFIDKEHNLKGGGNVRFSAGEKFRDLYKNSKELDPFNHKVSCENVDLVVKRKNNITVYEWKIGLGNSIKVNKVIGLDLIIADADKNQKEEEYAFWTKDSGNKNRSSIELGDIILADKDVTLGWLKGKIENQDTSINQRQNRLRITSINDSNFWIKTDVDSLGYFETYLPVGKYSVKPLYKFTSNLYSSGFNQNSRKIIVEEPSIITATDTDITKITSLRFKTVAPLLELFEKQGILFNKKIDEQEIDKFVTTFQNYLNIPGISVALIKNGEVVYKKNNGVKNSVSAQPLTSNTLFEAASITKTVFAVMVLKLAEKDIIDLDKPLYKYFPFPNVENDERSKLLTARIILNHQSGMPNWVGGYPGRWKNGNEFKLKFKPGTDFSYSGEAINYLGRVVTHLTKKSLSQLFNEEIVNSFGLKNTFFTYNDSLNYKSSLGHYQDFPF